MKTLSLLISFTLLNGCVHFQEQPLSPSVSFSQLEARSLQQADLQQFIANYQHGSKPSSQWNLDRLSLAALYFHPDLALARAQADSAEAATLTAAQHPNPSLAISPFWISNIAAAMPWIFASSLSVPIETAGKRGYRMTRSQHLTEAAELRITDTAWQIRGRLRLALLDVYAANETLRLLQQQAGIGQSLNISLQQQLAAGEIAHADVLAAQLALEQTQLNVTAAQKKQVESLDLLAAAIGVPATAVQGIALDFSEFSQFPHFDHSQFEQLKKTALHERSDLKAARSDYEAAQSALQLEIANQYPNLQANPGYTRNILENRWGLGITALQLPIFNQNEGPIAEMEPKRRELAVRFEALQLRILGEIDRAHAALLAAHQRLTVAEQQWLNRSDYLHTTQALVAAGELDQSALKIAELALSIAERAHLDVQVENQQALAQLEIALRYTVNLPMPPSMSSATQKKNPNAIQ